MGQQILMALFAVIACAAGAQNAPSFQGETALKTQFVNVQPDVKLESYNRLRVVTSLLSVRTTYNCAHSWL